MAVPKPKNSAGRNLTQAVGVGISLGALAIVALLRPYTWYPLVAIALAIAIYEVWRRLYEAGYVLNLSVLILGGQVMTWLSWPFGPTGLVAGFATSVLLLMVTRLFHHGRKSPPHNYVRDTAVGIFILAWIPLFGSFAAMLSRMSTETESGVVPGSAFIVTFMLCVVASDIGGYVFGVFFGTHSMAPAVSPKKSWEGFAGSIIFAIAAGVACVVILLKAPFWIGILLGGGLAMCGTLGDLVESQFKRDLGIKDMSGMLPGHGGLMDRLDGLLPAAMVTWVVLNMISGV